MKVENGLFLVNKKEFYYVEVHLPKTTLLVVGNQIGYFMCGALDVEMFNAPHLLDRKVVCGKAIKVKTIDELVNAPLYEVSKEAENMGIYKGTLVKDALLKISN